MVVGGPAEANSSHLLFVLFIYEVYRSIVNGIYNNESLFVIEAIANTNMPV